MSEETPDAVAYIRDVLRGLDVPWFLSGGWAADAWLGRQTRAHADVDITVFHDDQRAVFDHLAGWALVAHDPNVPDATTEQWDGRWLDLPAHVHVPTRTSALATSPARIHTAYELELILNARTERTWVLQPAAGIAVPIELSTRLSPWGLPTAPPEIVIFFKAFEGSGEPRPHDVQDFLALLPMLPDAARSWLYRSIAVVRPDHPWLGRLQHQ